MREDMATGEAVGGEVGEGRMEDMAGEAEGVNGRSERLISRRWRKEAWSDRCCLWVRSAAAVCREIWRAAIVEREVEGGRVLRWVLETV